MQTLMRSTVIVLAVMLGLTVPLFAQTPAEKPSLSTVAKASPIVPKELADTDALKLTNYLLTSENLHLKIQALQADLAKMQTDVQAFVRGLDRPGFHLERDPKGGWIYVANPPEKPPEKK
jgi:hypothetical protein